MKRIVVTGADGNLGGRLVKRLADETDYGVIAVSSFPERLPEMVERGKIVNNDKVSLYSSEEFFSADLSALQAEGAVHLAFSRGIYPSGDIASSLDYSLAAFRKIADSGVQNAIYVSSQSVYGAFQDFRTPETEPSPSSVYAMAKYAGEKLFEAVYIGKEQLQHTILRLDLVAQSQRLIIGLCKSAMETGVLILKGGKQLFSYIDADDVPTALTALLLTDKQWRPVYNVGHDRERYTLTDVAKVVCEVAAEHGKEVTIQLTEDDTALYAGMDTSAFLQDTGWLPCYSLKEIITRIYESLT